MTTETSEWLTVAEAARRLGLSDRHARRLADRLTEPDRLKQGTSPLRVRLAAMAQLWEREGGESESQTPAEAESDSATLLREEAVSRARLEERLDAAETLIAELREDKQHLQETLHREQENHLRLLDQLSDERRDLRLMHARPLQSLPPGPEPEPPFFRASPHAVPEDAEELPSASSLPPAAPFSPPAVPPPTFWQRLARWISD